MIKLIKQLNRLQTSSLKTYQSKYGHYTGAKYYNLLHGKCNGNIIRFALHLSSSDLNNLINLGLPKNAKLTHTVKN